MDEPLLLLSTTYTYMDKRSLYGCRLGSSGSRIDAHFVFFFDHHKFRFSLPFTFQQMKNQTSQGEEN